MSSVSSLDPGTFPSPFVNYLRWLTSHIPSLGERILSDLKLFLRHIQYRATFSSVWL